MAEGKVKEVKKRHGFITDNQTGIDALIHYSVLKDGRFAWEDVVEGVTVTYETEVTDKGLRVSKISKLGNKDARGSIVEPIIKPRLPADQAFVGTFKFFNAEKRYGFVGVEGFEDVFVHISDVRSHRVKKDLENGRVPKGTRFNLLSRHHTIPARPGRPESEGVAGIILGYNNITTAAVVESATTTKGTSLEVSPSSIADVAFLRNPRRLASTTST